MTRLKRLALPVLLAALTASAALGAPPPAPGEIAAMNLSAPFAARSPWRFSVTQGPVTNDTATGDPEPGEIRPCLRRSPSQACDPQLQTLLRPSEPDGFFSTPHYLNTAKVVHGAGGRPLLLVQTGSHYGSNGDQLVLTQVLAYRPSRDRFERVYALAVGHNNNQDVRFIETGRLKGDIISAEPTDNAPFGFWITVSAPTPAGPYKQILRYRSATRYDDGNPLAVIDSEMVGIHQRLGLWRPGKPLPLPAGACPKPHLIGMELWCR